MLDNIKVREWMSTPVVSISPNTPIAEAHQIMKAKDIRRLPVVDKHDRLVGILTIGDIREAKPSDATTLSIWELNYLWAQLKAEKAMTRNVVTVCEEDMILTAVRVMLDSKISGLPVMDKDDHLVGILAVSDIFRVLVDSYSKTTKHKMVSGVDH